MAMESEAFERIYRDYLAQLADLDLATVAGRLGGQLDGDAIVVPFYGRLYRVSPGGILDPAGKRPAHSVSVVLSKYLLMCPDASPPDGSWVSYRDFKDAGPFVGGLRSNAEVPLERVFATDLSRLERGCALLGGVSVREDYPYEVAMKMPALPRIPILLLFNGADEELPARCSMLFEKRAAQYLDMECLAITGWALSTYLCTRQ